LKKPPSSKLAYNIQERLNGYFQIFRWGFSDSFKILIITKAPVYRGFIFYMGYNIILWDKPVWEQLLPFTFTRPAGAIRAGILTIAEKYEKLLPCQVSHLTKEHLQKKYPVQYGDNNWLINAGVIPNNEFIAALKGLNAGESLWNGETFLAAHLSSESVKNEEGIDSNKKEYEGKIYIIDQIWKIFSCAHEEIKNDFYLLTNGCISQPIHQSNFVKNPENVFIEEGATVEFASLNASEGPIYIGKDAEVMEGALIRGPFSLGEHSTIKMGAKIYGGTSIGPHCKVGGEISNAVFFGYANKGHDGFVGNAVIGEWCNLGADTNNSNLKNNYEEVKVWSYAKKSFEKTGLQFCGLFMGDHSKCGINTMFNTGTVVGVSANIFGGGFPRNYIPSYSWGGSGGFTTYQFQKAIETAERVMERRHIELTEADREILQYAFSESQS